MVTVLLVLACVEALAILGLVFRLLKPTYDGVMVVTDTAEKKLFSLEIQRDPDELDKQKTIMLEVKKVSDKVARE